MKKENAQIIAKGLGLLIGKIKKPFAKSLHYVKYERNKQDIYSIVYLGYKVFYKKGDGLINHLAAGYSYEPDVLRVLKRSIKPNTVFFDVGANIGLISLFVLKNNPTVKIYGFEPSPYPFDCFRKTIDQNKLNAYITLENIGLYNHEKTVNFHIHGISNALGDGIKDTKRAGKAENISIKVTTIDKYVKKRKIKKIDCLKIDVEGAELYVLKGAIKTLKKYKPLIIFEANRTNIKAYNLIASKIYKFLVSVGYKIFSLKNKELSEYEFVAQTVRIDNFLAKYNEKN